MQWLAEICVHRPVFATVIVMFLTVVGGFSFFTLGVDRFPHIDLPTISVSVNNTGAAPAEMETEVTDPIEGALNTVPGIDEMRSTSSRGSSNITLTFNLEKNPDQAFQEVQQKLSTVVNRLPENADPPVARKSDPDSAPVLMYAVSSPRSMVELSDLVTTLIQDKIESADGVGEVVVFGSRPKQIKLFIDPDRLRAYNLSVTQVTAAVTAQNQELPGGTLNEGVKTVGLRTISKLSKAEDFNDIVIASKNNFPIKFRDIGRVEVGGADPTSALSLDGTQSVSVGVRKQSGSNTVAVINNIKERMATILPTLPKDIKVAVIRDQSEFIENSLHAIEEHLVLGAIFAAVVVFLFLWNLRATVISAFAIPTSIIASFALIAALGYSLNQMTMLALTLMVGIVIDDAIVVLENIYRFVEEKGMDPFRAAVEGTREIGLAVLATTMALLAVFIPVGLMTGIVGRFMSSFGLTSAAAIAVSLIVSFTLTPMLAARWIKRREEHEQIPTVVNPHSELGEDMDHVASDSVTLRNEGHEQSSKEGWFYSKVDGTYTWLLQEAMRFRWAVVLICVVTVVSIVPLYKFVGMAFLPDEDESVYQISVRGPQGTSLAATQSILDRIARDVREQIPGLQNTVVNAGGFGAQGGNSGNITVSLVPVSDRKQGQQQLINQTRNIVKKYSNQDWRINVSATSSIAQGIGLGRGGSGIGYYISGPDMDQLNKYADQIVDRLQKDATFRDPDNSVDVGTPEVQFIIDRAKAADLGVVATDISRALNIAAAGQRVSTFNEGTQEYDVIVQADEKFRRTRENLQYFTVASSKGNPVDLNRLVTMQEAKSASSIARLNRQRFVTISSSLPPNSSEADALAKLQTDRKSTRLN